MNPTTGDVTVDWNPSTSVDVDVYSVYKLINGYKIFIGDVNHPTTSFINFRLPPDNTSSDANWMFETYFVSATDGAPPPGPNESELSNPHHTMYLESSFDSCYSEVRLWWNHYDTWLSGTQNYQIYSKINVGPWVMIDVVEGEINSFVHHDVLADSDYSYYVVANSASGSSVSKSNMVSELTDMAHAPVTFHANYASVVSENYIEVSFTVDLVADVSSYKIVRGDDIYSYLDTIATISAYGLLNNVITYTDNAPTNITHYYKMIAINESCNVPFSKTTNFASNIVLSGESRDDLKNALIWTNYFKWDVGISYYDVIRVVDDNSSVVVAEIPYGDSTFLDKVDEYLYDPLYNPLDPLDEINMVSYLEQPVVSGNICYRVRAYEGDGANIGTYSSTSNTFCVIQQPRVFIPNAFSPNSDGLNDLFYPFVSFAGLNNYEFIIFDRWGQLVYETDHPHDPWDGLQINSDKMAPPGAYIYMLKLVDGHGESHMYKGDVILIR